MLSFAIESNQNLPHAIGGGGGARLLEINQFIKKVLKIKWLVSRGPQ